MIPTGLQAYPFALLYVSYPRPVRWLRRFVNWQSKIVYRLERATARYTPVDDAS